MNLNEAFQKMNLLESEDFNISSSMDSADLRNFIDEDEVTSEVDIIDAQADTEDDIEDSYIGKVVTECVICHSKFYKDPTEIVIDDSTGTCNVDEECPVCFSQDGYKIVGKIVPYNFEETVPSDEDNSGETVPSDEEEDLTECNHLQGCEECNESLEEDIQSATIETEDTTMSMDSDENGKVTITTEPKNVSEGETIAPVNMEDAIDISEIQDVNSPDEDTESDEESEVSNEDTEDTVDVDVEDFDEESFDELGESYLKRVYENVNSYKTNKVSAEGDKLIVEGTIKFTSGKSKPTSFIFESYRATKSGKVKFIGENAQITKGKKAFTITGNVNKNKFMTESLNYNYRQKDKDGKSVRLYGTVRK